MALKLNTDLDIVEDGKATAYFEDFLSILVDELAEVNVAVNYVDVATEQVPATDTTIYTVPSTASASEVLFGNCNATTTDTLTVNIVQSGGSVAATNEYISALAITAGTAELLTDIKGVILQTGDFISVKAANASRLNLKLSIKEFLN